VILEHLFGLLSLALFYHQISPWSNEHAKTMSQLPNEPMSQTTNDQ
jgi:hypothetical protein